MTPATPLTLSLVVRAHWANAASLRNIVAELVKVAIGDEEAAANAGMVGCELAENAIKYGDWSGRGGFDFRLTVDGSNASIEVTSPYDPSSGSLARLERILGSMREHSAQEAYVRRLAEVAEKTGEVGQLGLLRIAHELGAQITVRADVSRLCVRATWMIDDVAGAASRRSMRV